VGGGASREREREREWRREERIVRLEQCVTVRWLRFYAGRLGKWEPARKLECLESFHSIMIVMLVDERVFSRWDSKMGCKYINPIVPLHLVCRYARLMLLLTTTRPMAWPHTVTASAMALPLLKPRAWCRTSHNSTAAQAHQCHTHTRARRPCSATQGRTRLGSTKGRRRWSA
jgi:hypothetical protein